MILATMTLILICFLSSVLLYAGNYVVIEGCRVKRLNILTNEITDGTIVEYAIVDCEEKSVNLSR